MLNNALLEMRYYQLNRCNYYNKFYSPYHVLTDGVTPSKEVWYIDYFLHTLFEPKSYIKNNWNYNVQKRPVHKFWHMPISGLVIDGLYEPMSEEKIHKKLIKLYMREKSGKKYYYKN